MLSLHHEQAITNLSFDLILYLLNKSIIFIESFCKIFKIIIRSGFI